MPAPAAARVSKVAKVGNLVRPNSPSLVTPSSIEASALAPNGPFVGSVVAFPKRPLLGPSFPASIAFCNDLGERTSLPICCVKD